MLGKITVALFFLLLIWGNLVAGLGVGLACPDWPLCHGRIIPPFEFGILMEWTHRNLALLGTVFFLILSYKRFRSYMGMSKLIPIFALFLLLFQIVLGGIVVLLELPVDITTVHFGNAIIIYAFVFYMAFFDGNERKPVFSISSYSGLFFLLAIVIFAQAVLGAYVRHSSSGLACPDFPTCLGYWVPPQLSGSVLIHYSHRSLAYLIFILTALIFAFSYVNSEIGKNRSKVGLLLGLILFQIILGVGVVHTKLNFSVTALHLGAALLIFSTALYIWFLRMTQKHV